MKIYRIVLTSEEQKKLQQLLGHLKQRDAQSFFLLMLNREWLGNF